MSSAAAPDDPPVREGLVEALAHTVTTSRTVRVPLADLRAAAVRYDASLLTDPLWRDEVAGAVAALTVRGLAEPSATLDRQGLPPLPAFVKRLRVATRAARPAPRAWVDALSGANELSLSSSEGELLYVVNDWLRDHPGPRELQPLRERAYELLGDEKALDKLASSRLFREGVLTFQTLSVYPTPPPLATVTLGSAPWVLIVENSATFASLTTVLTELTGRSSSPGAALLGDLAYGAGRLAPHAIGSVQRHSRTQQPYEHAVYYGDVDSAGLDIAAQVSRNALAAQQCPVQPATALYTALLTRSGRAADPIDPALAVELSRWLGPALARPAADLLSSGRVLRQEALGQPGLRAVISTLAVKSSDWRTFVAALTAGAPTR